MIRQVLQKAKKLYCARIHGRKGGSSSLWAFWPLSILKCPIFLPRGRKCTISSLASPLSCCALVSERPPKSPLQPSALWAPPACLFGVEVLSVTLFLASAVAYRTAQRYFHSGGYFQLLTMRNPRLHKIPLKATLSLLCELYGETEGSPGTRR